MSVDPLTSKYPELTPYQFASNTPIWAVDIDGLEAGLMWPQNMTAKKYSDVGTEASKWYHDVSPGEKYVFKLQHGWEPQTKGDLLLTLFNEVGGAMSHNYGAQVPNTRLRVKQPQTPEAEVPSEVSKPKINIASNNEVSTNTDKQSISANNKQKISSPTLLQKKTTSFKSEAVVKARLEAQLKPNEILMEKPRFYIKDGDKETWSTPDFAIYNTKTDQFVKIPDAKNGGAGLSPNQEILNTQGGEFRGSSRYPKAKPQSIAPGMVKEEKTSIPYQ